MDSKDVRRHVDWILGQLVDKPDVLHRLQRAGCRMDISCFWVSKSGHGGPMLGPATMRQLAVANLEIGFDVYFCENMPSGQGSWFVRGFERFGDSLLSEQPLTGVDADILTDFIQKHWADFIRKHWTRPGDEEDPSLLLCLSYPLTPGIAEALREQVGVEANLDFSREEYFLEYNV